MPRREGNSEFVDDNLTPYLDQWKLLKAVQRVALDHLDWTVVQAARQGAVIAVRAVDPDPDDFEDEPWRRPPSRKVAQKPVQGPFPPQVEVVLGNMVFVPKLGLPEALLSRIIRIAAFQNPEFYKAQAMRMNTWDKPRIIGCAGDLAAHLALPRNCCEEVVHLLRDHKIKVMLRDERTTGRPISARFLGELRTDQNGRGRNRRTRERRNPFRSHSVWQDRRCSEPDRAPTCKYARTRAPALASRPMAGAVEHVSGIAAAANPARSSEAEWIRRGRSMSR